MNIEETTAILYKISQAIMGRLLIKDLSKNIIQACKDVMNADASSLFLYDYNKKNRDRFVMMASSGYPNDLSGKAEYFRKSQAGEKIGLTGWIAQTGETFMTKSRKEFSNCKEYNGGKYDNDLWGPKDSLKCQSFFGAPIKTADDILGVLKVESSRENHFGNEHQLVLQIIGSMTASAIQNLMIIESFHSVFEIIAKFPTEKKKLYDYFVRTCADLVQAEACSIFNPNDKGRLVLRGDYGHDFSLVDKEDNEYTYEPGEGVTGTVFFEGGRSRAKSKEEILNNPKHESKLYRFQWRDPHECHSWYQFCIGEPNTFGVMKVENKLEYGTKPIVVGGFSDSDEKILEIFANSVIPIIEVGRERTIKEKAITALHSIGVTSDINEIFSPELIMQIESLQKVRNKNLHEKVLNFVEEVKIQRLKAPINYLEFAKQHINSIGESVGVHRDLIEYCGSLEFFEPILYQIEGYRSHFVHQLNVFLNGYLILNMFDDNKFEKLEEVIKRRSEKPVTELIDVFNIWFITTMFHDTGYPIGKIRDWTQSFICDLFKKRFIDITNIANEVVQALAIRLFRIDFRIYIDRLINELLPWIGLQDTEKGRIIKGIYDLFFDDLNENLISSLILINAAENIKIDECSLRTAVSAILLDSEKMWDNLMEIDKTIYYLDHPIAFLLMYCDNIQEYGRPKTLYTERKGRIGKIPQLDEYRVEKQIMEFGNKSIQCNLIYKKKPENWDSKVKPILSKLKKCWKAPKDLNFIITYESEGNRFDDLYFAW